MTADSMHRQRQQLYDPNTPALLQARRDAKILCQQFNLLPPEDAQATALLHRLLGHISGSFCILPPFWCDYGSQISLGERFFSNHNSVMLDAAPITFGNDVFIAPNCGFYTAGHPIDAALRRQGLEYALPIAVGNDVWIGAGTQVLPGVRIGSNVVIGAGSVVARDIPDHCVAVGNPCKVIRWLNPTESG